jgi:hypothetical protein
MKLSKYFTKEEFEHSNTAVQRSISNVMDSGQTQKAIDLCENVLDKIREYTNKPLKLNCGYRSPLVNKAVGGAKSSQHILGEAADLDLHSRELFVWIIENLEFDQAIFEFGTDDNAGWFHLSYRKGRNRKQALRAKKQAGKTVYVPFV